jgi:hypothetical protein
MKKLMMWSEISHGINLLALMALILILLKNAGLSLSRIFMSFVRLFTRGKFLCRV